TWREDIITSGLGRVEGVAVDWIAGMCMCVCTCACVCVCVWVCGGVCVWRCGRGWGGGGGGCVLVGVRQAAAHFPRSSPRLYRHTSQIFQNLTQTDTHTHTERERERETERGREKIG